mmetsp:Transcript_66211/g.137970  ORF Transcript_66211/g.137970 Transcript_66211/m.137970 type:complete len:316 (-) Transcript_66211:161-1108(-)
MLGRAVAACLLVTMAYPCVDGFSVSAAYAFPPHLTLKAHHSHPDSHLSRNNPSLLSKQLFASAPLSKSCVPLQSARSRSCVLGMSSSEGVPKPVKAEGTKQEEQIDLKEIGSYFGGTLAEVAIICAVMFAMQYGLTFLPPLVSQVVVGLFFLGMSVKSRIFAIFDASRPMEKEKTMDKVYTEVKRPAWSPPGIVFPIVWSSIGLLRAASSFLVWEACGRELLVVPIIAMMVHLSIGDTWNYVNNQQQRQGTAVAGVSFVWMSAVAVTALYYQALPLAGKLLAPSVVWLSVASCLIFSIWRLNGSQPILPRKAAAA